MNRERIIWTILFLFGGTLLLLRAATAPQGFGKAYMKETRVSSDIPNDSRTRWIGAQPIEQGAVVSMSRTAGLWLSAFLTLAILSFLYRDNVFYKVAESLMVGVSAGWAMVAGFWDGIVGTLFARLAPGPMRDWALPDIPDDQQPNLLYLIPLALGAMLLWRLVPRGGWIARWPLAFIVGTYAGLRLITFLDADFVTQIRSTLMPLIVILDGRFNLWASLRNLGLIVGVLSCLTYFFFSLEHTGFVGRVSRVGIWFLMITFGASFAFTVMGRIALLAARLEFLFDDWLWLIDPTGKRPPGW